MRHVLVLFLPVMGLLQNPSAAAADVAAASRPQVLRQSGIVPKPAFPICLVDPSALQDGFVEVKFKPLSGEIDQAGGVVWRSCDATKADSVVRFDDFRYGRLD